MERLLISQLLKWKDSHGRKPLLLEGARQVGSTSLLPYERNNSSKTINIPLYMLFVLDKELKAES
jgi:predicted AAA+ superfamily ATPase